MEGHHRDTVFVTIVTSPAELSAVALLVRCLRTFGGEMKDMPGFVLTGMAKENLAHFQSEKHITIVPLPEERSAEPYFFRSKVMACAQAERLLQTDGTTLIWLNPMTLVLQEPTEFLLAGERKAAFRPVHVQNIGQHIGEPLDPYWAAVYERVGRVADRYHVTSLLDGKDLRPYFNSHLFAVDTSFRIMQEWEDIFNELVQDDGFQRACCADILHQVFLHQAVLSALIDARLERAQIHILPEEYSYPLHFHLQLNVDRQARSLDDLVCPVYEEGFHYPETLSNMSVSSSLSEWLQKQSRSV